MIQHNFSKAAFDYWLCYIHSRNTGDTGDIMQWLTRLPTIHVEKFALEQIQPALTSIEYSGKLTFMFDGVRSVQDNYRTNRPKDTFHAMQHHWCWDQSNLPQARS